MFAPQAEGVAPTHYYEVDFPEVTKKKAAIMANREALHKLVGHKIDPQSIGDSHPRFLYILHMLLFAFV